MSRKRFDTLWHGLIPGLLLPALTLVVFWKVKSDMGFVEFLEQFQRLKMLSKVVSLSVIPNLLLFFIFIWTSRNFSARGVIFSTLLLALVMVILKFV
jgi:hypothetical protein